MATNEEANTTHLLRADHMLSLVLSIGPGVVKFTKAMLHGDAHVPSHRLLLHTHPHIHLATHMGEHFSMTRGPA